jgi:glycosyltransferase involved in cell wall biosynthesis
VPSVSRNSRPLIDIVIPVYNEGEIIAQTHERICSVVDSLPYEFSFLYVDDGSTDDTPIVLESLAEKDSRVRFVELSRNFGHQAALTAGLDASRGDVVITMDGDGQHPPEMIPQLLNFVERGFDIVQAQRVDDAQSSSFKNWTSNGFYKLINLISGTYIVPGAADFRALTRQAVNALKSMPEFHRFLRGMVAWIGFPMVIVPYRPAQRIGGKSKYSLGKMFRLAMDAIFSFSLVPLYIGLSMGGLLLCLAMLEMIYVLSFWVTGQTSNLAPGWSSLMFVILIVGGMLMVLLGFIGVYVGYIFQEVKRRPVYLVKQKRESSN